ncbi:VRR-NUC domain-containing protein [bacterium]|nr:MAG: VRR-NUC domain-containing protein [bacterium]
MEESRLERRFKNEVEKRGGKALKFVSPGMRGVPDRIVLIPGPRTVFAEIKKPGEKLEPLQIKRKSEFEAMGYKVYEIDSIADINHFILEVFSHEI